MTTPRKATTLAELEALTTGIPTYCANRTMILAGQTYTAAEAVQIPAAILAAEAAVVLARAAYREALQARVKVETETATPLRLLRGTLRLMFKRMPVALAELKLKDPRPASPLSTEALLVKKAKAKATREARGTKGKRQKAKILGGVKGVKITPVVKPD